MVTALVWMLTWLPRVLAAMSELPRPVILALNSSRFDHVLAWEPGPGTPSGVHYRVTMSTTTWASWVPVAGCEHVQRPLLCDLTHAFSDRTQVYLTRVAAVLEGRTSPPATHPGFQPIRDTYLDPPLLSVAPCDARLCVDLQPPAEHLRDVYESLHYQLRIQTSGVERRRFSQDAMSLRRQTLDNLAPGRPSCVSVRFSGSGVRRKSNYSRPVCAAVPADHDTDRLLLGLLCLLVSCGVVAVALLVATGYFCLRREPPPFVLTSIRHLDRTVVLAPSCVSLASLLYVKPMAPSSGEMGSNQTLTDENGTGETGGGGGGGHYTIKVDLNRLVPPPSAPLLPVREPPPCSSSYRTSDSPPLSNETSRWESDRQASEPPPDTTEPDKVEEEAAGGGGDEEVNLRTLTFGWNDEEEEEEEEEEERSHDEGSCASEDAASVLPTQTWEIEESGSETLPRSVGEEEEEEEEEEDNSGYIGHPSVFRN
ncbi:interferon alpha/beta receptor 2-like [Brachionichthys hirsutus]|uniref:interferon alpha/beta receptor 2-like n=1 Tax=Brachionichthys hirsutus TaxID=412623 RepID=UPI0036044749